MLNLNQTDIQKEYLGKFLFILSLFLLGLMIFLIIQKPFLHIDEWFTQGLITLSFGDMVHITATDVHPPFYYATVWVPVKILNSLHIPFSKIFVMKMMSVLPCAILLAISFTKIRKDYGWFTAGFFSFTLLAMSNFFTTFSIARMYPLGILLLVCGFIAAGEILKNSKPKYWIMLTIFTVLGAYTQYYLAFNFIILYALLFLYILIKDKSELRNWLSSTVFIIISYIPWTFVLYRQLTSVQGGGVLSITEITFNTFLASFSSVFSTSQDILPQIISAIVIIALFILVLKKYKESPDKNEFILLGFLIFIGTILCAATISVLFKPILLVRYLLPAAAVVLLSTSILISRLDFRRIIVPVVIVLLLFGAVNLYGQIDEISKNHEKLVDNQKFLDSINNDNSVVIVTSKVKLIHFYNQLKNANVYQDYTIDNREGARDYARILDGKEYKFFVPVDTDYFNNQGKNVYIAYRDDGSKLELPPGYSLEPVGRVENTQFSKLVHSSK